MLFFACLMTNIAKKLFSQLNLSLQKFEFAEVLWTLSQVHKINTQPSIQNGV